VKTRLLLVVINLLLLEVATGYSQPEQEKRYYQIKVKDKIGFINSSGKVIIEPQFAAAGNFVDGLAPARKDAYYGYVDTTGRFVILPIYDFANDFDHGVGKVYTAGYNVSYIKTTGETAPPDMERVLYDTNGQLIVQTRNSRVNRVPQLYTWRETITIDSRSRFASKGIIARDGSYIKPPIYGRLNETPNPNCFIYELYDTLTHRSTGMGFIDYINDSITPPYFDDLHIRHATYDFVPAYIDNKMAYINYSGSVIWQDKFDRYDKEYTLNIDYQCNIHYSPRGILSVDHANAVSRTAREDLFSIRYPLPDSSIKALVLEVNTSDTIRDVNHILCYTLTVFNGTDTDQLIPSRCRSHYYVMQAKDRDGTWRDIEVNHCTGDMTSKGNSTISPKQYTKYEVRIYDGGYKTKLRMKGNFKSGTVYSNEFDGAINPGQFWRPWNLDSKDDYGF
jgi:hypothetical protein